MTGSVEIAGGGIAGLTAGLAFARKGWRVRVHEQDGGLRIPGAGIYIWENGLRVLEALGVLAQVIAGAIPASQHEKRNHDGSVFYGSDLGPGLRLYVPLRRTLLTALYDGLVDAGGEVVFDSRAAEVTPCGRLQFCDGSAVTGDLVVAADGVNSPLRDSLGLLRRRCPAGQFGYRAMIRRQPDELSTDIGRTHCEHWSGSRRLLYAPCTADLAYVQLTSLADDDAGNQVPVDRDCWHRAFPRQDWIIDRLPDQGHSDWFERVQVSDWSSGRVALVGDAASAQPPFLGQGGGCAMMSGFALAEAVERAGDVIAGIDMWKRRQRRLIEWVQRVSYWYGQLAFCPAPVRTAAFKAIGRSGALKRTTLLVAARHDPTAAGYWSEPEPMDAATLLLPMIH